MAGQRCVRDKGALLGLGGVLATNAWDHRQRAQALEHFGLDREEFTERHELVVSSFERGKISLDEYLDGTVFYQQRRFSREEFKQVMYSLSQPDEEEPAFAQRLANSGKYLMGTINNESRELNQDGIENFGMRAIFTVFVSSCYVGLQKPEEGIYRLALYVTQQKPEECCFIDDRALHLEMAKRLGMCTLEMDGLEKLQQDRAKLEVG